MIFVGADLLSKHLADGLSVCPVVPGARRAVKAAALRREELLQLAPASGANAHLTARLNRTWTSNGQRGRQRGGFTLERKSS